LSTLTKVLIVLLTISSIFLCGIVVTYVANVENFKDKYTNLRADKNAAETNEAAAKKELNETITAAGDRERMLKDNISAFQTQIGKLKTDLTEAQRQTTAATEEEGKWKAATIEFHETNERQRMLLEDTLAKLKTIQAMQIKGDEELNETTAALIEKMAIIATLESRSRQLLEEKTGLQNNLDKLLQRTGQSVVAPVAVTPIKEKARVAPPTVDISLEGLIITVDLENSLAEISIGAANGVKQNMKFHVTRGDEFICDILILDVEPEKAVGTLELMNVTQKQPKAGDNVSTNL
jgi:outer membrane murein-binding lipoprotein Lpp